MPIRQENKSRYPKDWPQISKRIREMAGNKCEKCGAPNGKMIHRFRSEDYHFEPVYMLDCGHIYSADDGRLVGLQMPSFVTDVTDVKWVRVVLTVAHLDHTPENCADANLRAWCQRCHNEYDAPMRRAGIANRRRKKNALSDFFNG